MSFVTSRAARTAGLALLAAFITAPASASLPPADRVAASRSLPAAAFSFDQTAAIHAPTRFSLGLTSFHEPSRFILGAFTYDTELGVNFEGAPLWRATHLPGPTGLDDAPLVRIERISPAADPTLVTLLRDELGTTAAILSGEDLLGRILATPYGETALERGPEPRHVRFDATRTQADSQSQTPTSGHIPGALILTTSLPLDGATLAAGVHLQRWQGQWLDLGPTAIELQGSDLIVLPLQGWPADTSCRLVLDATITDHFTRAVRSPDTGATGFDVALDVPASGSPTFERSWSAFDTIRTASSTLDGALPGGVTSLFHGMWTDPVSGIAYARARWYDPSRGMWLAEDPIGAVDSPNLYAYVAWRPQAARDPMGMCVFGLPCPAVLERVATSVKSAGTDLVRGARQGFEPGARIVADATYELGSELPYNAQRMFDPRLSRAQRREASGEVGKAVVPIVLAEVLGPELRALTRRGGRALVRKSETAFADAGAAATTGAEVVGDQGAATGLVYRRLAKSDLGKNIWEQGLEARDPLANATPEEHVLGQRRTPWISTSRDIEVPRRIYGRDNTPIVEIDLSKVTSETVDLSDPAVRSQVLSDPQALSLAGRDAEVLVKARVPGPAIRRIIWPPRKN